MSCFLFIYCFSIIQIFYEIINEYDKINKVNAQIRLTIHEIILKMNNETVSCFYNFPQFLQSLGQMECVFFFIYNEEEEMIKQQRQFFLCKLNLMCISSLINNKLVMNTIKNK